MIRILIKLLLGSPLTNEHIDKILSGRYFLTIIGGAVFTIAVYKKILPDAATASILTAIFMSYFQRPDRQNGGGVK